MEKEKVIGMRVAIFDFDGTLYSKETFQLLMDHLKSHPVHSQNIKAFTVPSYRLISVIK